MRNFDLLLLVIISRNQIEPNRIARLQSHVVGGREYVIILITLNLIKNALSILFIDLDGVHQVNFYLLAKLCKVENKICSCSFKFLGNGLQKFASINFITLLDSF